MVPSWAERRSRHSRVPSSQDRNEDAGAFDHIVAGITAADPRFARLDLDRVGFRRQRLQAQVAFGAAVALCVFVTAMVFAQALLPLAMVLTFTGLAAAGAQALALDIEARPVRIRRA
jgi:hypothetical protein